MQAKRRPVASTHIARSPGPTTAMPGTESAKDVLPPASAANTNLRQNSRRSSPAAVRAQKAARTSASALCRIACSTAFREISAIRNSRNTPRPRFLLYGGSSRLEKLIPPRATSLLVRRAGPLARTRKAVIVCSVFAYTREELTHEAKNLNRLLSPAPRFPLGPPTLYRGRRLCFCWRHCLPFADDGSHSERGCTHFSRQDHCRRDPHRREDP